MRFRKDEGLLQSLAACPLPQWQRMQPHAQMVRRGLLSMSNMSWISLGLLFNAGWLSVTRSP